MKITFFTSELDETFYRQMIHEYILKTFVGSGKMSAFNKYKKFRNDWEIQIRPHTDWAGADWRSGETGVLNSKIPHGVTGEGIVKVYVIDTKDKGLFALQNFSAVFHEVAHMLMIILFRSKRGTFRNDDLGGNKKGSEANVSTQEVHDLAMEGHNFIFVAWINFGSWIFRKWRPFSAVGIDIRDYIKNNL